MNVEVYITGASLEKFKNFDEVPAQAYYSHNLFKLQVDLTTVAVTQTGDGIILIKRYSATTKANAETKL